MNASQEKNKHGRCDGNQADADNVGRWTPQNCFHRFYVAEEFEKKRKLKKCEAIFYAIISITKKL